MIKTSEMNAYGVKSKLAFVMHAIRQFVIQCSYKQIKTYFESLLNAVRCDTKDSPPTRRTVPKSCEISHLNFASVSSNTMLLNLSTWQAHYPAVATFAPEPHAVSMKYPFTHKSAFIAPQCLLETTSKMLEQTATGSDFSVVYTRPLFVRTSSQFSGLQLLVESYLI